MNIGTVWNAKARQKVLSKQKKHECSRKGTAKGTRQSATRNETGKIIGMAAKVAKVAKEQKRAGLTVAFMQTMYARTNILYTQ